MGPRYHWGYSHCYSAAHHCYGGVMIFMLKQIKYLSIYLCLY